MKYKYPLAIEFIDSLSSLVIIMIVPMITLGLAFLTYTILSNREAIVRLNGSDSEVKANSKVYWLGIGLLILILMAYSYYAFVQLDYISQLGNAFVGILHIILLLAFSPFIFLYMVFTVNNVQTDLFFDGAILFNDVKLWFTYKFGIQVSQLTQATFLAFFKIITLLLFSTKIINITKFLFYNMLNTSKTVAVIGSISVFVSLVVLYIPSHYDELLNLLDIFKGISKAFFQGAMR